MNNEQEKTPEQTYKSKQPNQEQKPGMSKPIQVLLVVTALFFDVIQIIVNFIPIAGQIIAYLTLIFAQLTLWLSFKLLGYSYYSKSTFLISFAELIPIINDLPTLTASVVKRLVDINGQEILSKVSQSQTISRVSQLAMKRRVSSNNGSGGKTKDYRGGDFFGGDYGEPLVN
jgi:hypothetical protein